MEQPQFVTFTSKGFRIAQLIEDGQTFDEAEAIADSEYASDGMSLKNPPSILPRSEAYS